ncbi:MAG: 6-phosphofructokinase [Candidatus Saganbacteria bacterium]|nr:6-phosphofructokinase [Candidatus Saganbacteria bacterium]
MKAIGIITTGGDAPGMNTAIRAVVRTAISHDLKAFGISHGWRGLIHGEIEPMDLKSVGGIINRGGTLLHSARCPEFKDKIQRKVAFSNLQDHGIDALVVIGGDGSIMATSILHKEFKIPTVNIPASIDNDIYGTDYTIGFDTAVNTAVDAIDKIRDTATSHERLFVIEVMGRESGSIALNVALVCGAEAVLVPEKKFDLNALTKSLLEGQARGKKSYIIVVAEGAAKAQDVAKALKQKTKFDVRVSILGHIQRGGSPSAASRELACKMGYRAVELLVAGKGGYMVGAKGEEIIELPLSRVAGKHKKIDPKVYELVQILSK